MNFYYWLGYHLSRLVGRLFFRLRVVHRERMLQSGPVILAMNHQSYLDPPLAGITCDRAVYFLARRTLLDVPLLGWLLPKLNVIPVNQEGVDRSALKALIRVLKGGNAALVFPEGSRTVDGSLQPAQPGLGLVIANTLAPVVAMVIVCAPRGHATRCRRFALCANYHRNRRTDFLYGCRSKPTREGSLQAAKPASHGCNRGLALKLMRVIPFRRIRKTNKASLRA